MMNVIVAFIIIVLLVIVVTAPAGCCASKNKVCRQSPTKEKSAPIAEYEVDAKPSSNKQPINTAPTKMLYGDTPMIFYSRKFQPNTDDIAVHDFLSDAQTYYMLNHVGKPLV